MLFTVLLSGFAVQCLSPLVNNYTRQWTGQDKVVFTRALTRCEEKFPNSPCLGTFKKLAERSFRATCRDGNFFTLHPSAVRLPASTKPNASFLKEPKRNTRFHK